MDFNADYVVQPNTKGALVLETAILGGCLCGAVRYAIDETPSATGICHCTHCQKQSGSAFSLLCIVAQTAFHHTGEMTTFMDVGDSGQPVERHFCGRCGSPIISVVHAAAGVVFVKAGTLDERDALLPTIEVYCDHAAPWLQRLPGAVLFPQGA